jgi:hypothetical protein
MLETIDEKDEHHHHVIIIVSCLGVFAGILLIMLIVVIIYTIKEYRENRESQASPLRHISNAIQRIRESCYYSLGQMPSYFRDTVPIETTRLYVP